ncbi:MAG: YbaK/EbsC family protein [Anaerolineales bacterium]|nr:YbaK/EbsC family protein [Anaerolineales bacterium]MCS7247397.1 YbaK/EbsC family protein [Anaerolineales bacterium]MDW8161208.1 YbaK/EbsC family protein [Anaerolineales bacterium]MDW8448262.1 YbaK/EbsC family protein [Anaerolineales bacterium]
MQKLSPSAQKVQEAIRQRGYSVEVIELPQSTRTAVEAAQAVGCEVAQIVKSLIFKTKRTARPILVIASGANRVNERTIEALVGEPLGKADAEFVRQQTGFAIGGVPPLGHIQPLLTFIDEDLLQHEEIWAAAGTPHAVFRLTPQMLLELCSGQVVKIR